MEQHIRMRSFNLLFHGLRAQFGLKVRVGTPKQLIEHVEVALFGPGRHHTGGLEHQALEPRAAHHLCRCVCVNTARGRQSCSRNNGRGVARTTRECACVARCYANATVAIEPGRSQKKHSRTRFLLKNTCAKIPNRLEFSFSTVLALPNASSTSIPSSKVSISPSCRQGSSLPPKGPPSRVAPVTCMSILLVCAKYWNSSLAVSVLPLPDTPVKTKCADSPCECTRRNTFSAS